MLSYRVVFLDGGGRRVRSEALRCGDDDQALERLARVRHPHPVELWQDTRLVWRFENASVGSGRG